MALIVKDMPMDREKPTCGMHDAVCVFVEDVGIQKSSFQGHEKLQHKVVFCFEIDEKMQKGEYAGLPFMVSSRYTMTLYEKGNLSKTLEGWFSKAIPPETRKSGFDLSTLVGRRCTVNLVESDDGAYINIGAVLPANKANVMTPVCRIVPKWIIELRDKQVRDPSTCSSDEPPVSIMEQEPLPF